MPSPSAALYAWAKLTNSSSDAANEIAGDIFLIDATGTVLLEITGLRLHRVARTADTAAWLHEVRWQPLPLPAAAAPSQLTTPITKISASGGPSKWLLLADGQGVATSPRSAAGKLG